MTDEVQALFSKILKDTAFSLTRPRQLVFELLIGHEPQSMHELVVRAARRVDRASLYRTLALFERLGIAQRVYVGWKYKLELTDIFSHHHHHISCIGCGKLVAIQEDGEIERLIASLAVKNKMTAERHQLEIQGYCSTCVPVSH